MIGRRIKKITALLLFLPENLEKYRSTEFYDAPLERSTIFLYRSSTSHTPLDSSGLAELKYAVFSRTGRKTKKLRCSLFLSTVSKHGLLEGSTFLFQYSSISRTKLESSLLGELKCTILAGYDIILKNKSIRKCKNEIVWRTYMVTVVWATRRIAIFFLDTATQAVHRWIALD